VLLQPALPSVLPIFGILNTAASLYLFGGGIPPGTRVNRSIVEVTKPQTVPTEQPVGSGA
jgi:hypothetical protein